MAVDIEGVHRELVRELRSRRREQMSIDLRAYLGSPVPVLGLSTPEMRGIVGSFVAGQKDLAALDLNRLATRLWSGDTFEEKALAIMLLSRYRTILNEETWDLLDGWVDEATGWGLCDGLASGPIAGMVHAEPKRFRELLRWTRSDHFWRRRASMYALRDFVQAKEFDRPFRLLERLLYDEEFWVQRAVGTWLRECWKRDRRRTEAFLRAHVVGLPRVVITVATERAPKAFREELRRKREGRTVRQAESRSRAGRPSRRSRHG